MVYITLETAKDTIMQYVLQDKKILQDLTKELILRPDIIVDIERQEILETVLLIPKQEVAKSAIFYNTKSIKQVQ